MTHRQRAKGKPPTDPLISIENTKLPFKNVQTGKTDGTDFINTPIIMSSSKIRLKQATRQK